MAEPFLFVLFKLVWQDLLEDVAYGSMKKSWQTLQVLIDENKQNKQVNQDLTFALQKCFDLSQKTIAEECRDVLIKNSTFTQYRGAKIYKPSENDRDIKVLENQVKLVEQQLKQASKNKSNSRLLVSNEKFEELLIQLSQSNYQFTSEVKENLENQLFAEAEKDCHVNIYQTKIRDEKYGLCKQIFHNFLIEVEPNEQLNSIFDVRAYLGTSKK